MLASGTSTALEDISKVLGNAPWFQLYMPVTSEETGKLIKRLEAVGDLGQFRGHGIVRM